MPRSRPFSCFRPLAAVVMVSVAAGCTDRNPAGVAKAPEPAPGTAVLRCDVDVRAGTLACGPVGAGTAPGVSAAIVGGQGDNVRLASSGTGYDAGAAVLRSDVTVENLTGQALGTTDGATPAAEGVRVFFHAGPDVTGGTGTVSVANPDGVGTFTGTGQPFFQYGGILAPGDTTPAKEWRFDVPATVSTFSFTVYVAAPVAREDGWIGVSPLAPALLVGQTVAMQGTVHGVTGRVLAGETVAWTSSSPSVATVSASGVVTAAGPGTVKITAASGARTGSVWLNVASGSTPAPEVVSFAVSPVSVNADGVDSVSLTAHLRDGGPGTAAARFTLVNPAGSFRRVCQANAASRVSGTAFDGVYRCRLGFPAGSWNGAWTVEKVEAVGLLARTREVAAADLRAAGAPAQVHVAGASEDVTAPSLDGFTVTTPVSAGVDSLVLAMTVSDAGTGVAQAGVWIQTYGNGGPGSKALSCVLNGPFSGTRASGVFRCGAIAPARLAGGVFYVDSVRVRDGNGNTRLMNEYELAAAGFPTEVLVHADPAPPQITGFSFSPATVAANGVDSVTVTISATDALSGVTVLDAIFQKVGDPTRTRDCYSGTMTAQPSHTFTCKLRFGPGDAGSWEVTQVRAVDFMNHLQALTTAQAQAAGYPTALTVTP